MKTEAPYRDHPIQIDRIDIIALSAKLVGSGKTSNDGEDENHFVLKVAHSEFLKDQKQIVVMVSCDLFHRDNKEKPGYEISASVSGLFNVDVERFPVQFVEDWAEKNAPLVLYPMLREHIYNLSSRCGIQKIILPLLEVPTYKIVREGNPLEK